MGFFSNLGHKVSGFVDKGISIGKKVSHATEGIAHKVSSIAGTAALGAAAIGLEPVAAGLGAVAGTAKAVELGARTIGEGIDKAEAVSGAVRSGIERVKTITGSGSFGSKVDAVKGLAGDVRAIKANLPSRKRRP
tara:strand:+ start:105 stop:509 length:405 start_codon:yes stop_codon:yes gene_type:complete